LHEYFILSLDNCFGYKINRVDGDTLSMALRCPELRLVGKYKVSGQIFALPIEGAGTFWMIMGYFV